MSSERIIADHVSYRYPGAEGLALEDVSCSLYRGEVVGLVGLSASGKSTFSRLLKGLTEPTAGRFLLEDGEGKSTRLNSVERLKLVGWTDPHPERQIFGATVEEETAYGPANRGLAGEELAKRVNWALRMVGFEPAEYLTHDPRRLSGGEKRRLALAGVIAMRTPYYIFDEPTAGLDYNGRRFFFSTVEKLTDDGCSVVWITHNIRLLGGAVNRLWGMEAGRLVLDMKAEDVDWARLAQIMEAGESVGKLESVKVDVWHG